MDVTPKSDLDQLRHKISTLESRLQASKMREANLEKSHAAQGEALRKAAGLSAQVEKALELNRAAVEKATQLETVIASGKQENEQLRERLNIKEESLAQALNWKKELEAEYAELERKYAALLKEKHSWQAKLDAAYIETRSSWAKVNDLEKRLKDALARVSTFAADVNHLHDLLLAKSNDELMETRRQLQEEREAHDPSACGEGEEYCQLKRLAKKSPEASSLLHRIAPFPESTPPGPAKKLPPTFDIREIIRRAMPTADEAATPPASEPTRPATILGIPVMEMPPSPPPEIQLGSVATEPGSTPEERANERADVAEAESKELTEELADERRRAWGMTAEQINERWKSLFPTVAEAAAGLRKFSEAFPSIGQYQLHLNKKAAQEMTANAEKTADAIVSMMKPTLTQREMVLREIRESLKRYPDAPMDLGIKEEIERLRLEAILQSLSAQPLPNEGKRGGKSANPPPAWRNWTSWLRRHLRFSLLAPKSPPISLKEPLEEMTLAQLQKQAGDWLTYNFGDEEGEGWINQFFCMVEEIGELAHASLKQRQGIRGTKEELEEKVKDAAADVIIATAGFCFRRGIDLQTAVEMAWAEVRVRDWTKERQKNGKG